MLLNRRQTTGLQREWREKNRGYYSFLALVVLYMPIIVYQKNTFFLFPLAKLVIAVNSHITYMFFKVQFDRSLTLNELAVKLITAIGEKEKPCS